MGSTPTSGTTFDSESDPDDGFPVASRPFLTPALTATSVDVGGQGIDEGKLNILDAFSNLFASTFPVRHPEMQLALRMEASTTESGSLKKVTGRGGTPL